MNLTVPAFGFSQSMARPVTKSPLDTRQLYSGLDFAAQDTSARNARLTNFGGYVGQHPGAAPGGTGDTGLAANDASGWAQLQERGQQYLKDIASANGTAAPTVRIGAYDGSHLPAADTTAPARSPKMANPAMSGLSAAMGSDGPPRMVLDDPDLYKAYKMSLLDSLQSSGRQARVAGMTPAEKAMESADTRVMDVAGEMRDFGRQQDDQDTMQHAASGYHAWDSYGKPQMRDQYDMYGDLAGTKAQAGLLDNKLDDDTKIKVAQIQADNRLSVAQKQAQIAALQVQGREVGNQRQFGRVDPAAMQGLNDAIGGMSGGGTGSASGGAGMAELGGLSADEAAFVKQTQGRFPVDQVIAEIKRRRGQQ